MSMTQWIGSWNDEHMRFACIILLPLQDHNEHEASPSRVSKVTQGMHVSVPVLSGLLEIVEAQMLSRGQWPVPNAKSNH